MLPAGNGPDGLSTVRWQLFMVTYTGLNYHYHTLDKQCNAWWPIN